MAAQSTRTTITRDDLENKLRSFQGEVRGEVDDRKQSILAAGAGLGMVLMIIVFLLGRRTGRKRSTVVEIRRV